MSISSISSSSGYVILRTLFCFSVAAAACQVGALVVVTTVLPAIGDGIPKLGRQKDEVGRRALGSLHMQDKRLQDKSSGDISDSELCPSRPVLGMPLSGSGTSRKERKALWAGNFPLLENMAPNVGLDISDNRGAFLRSYGKFSTPTRDIIIGKLSCSRWMAASRQKLWWLVSYSILRSGSRQIPCEFHILHHLPRT